MPTINNRLNILQAFNAMYELLEINFRETSSDVVVLLSSMDFLIDGCTTDQAIWEDWQALVKDYDPMTPMQAYDFAYKFIKNFFRGYSLVNAPSLINDMKRSENGTIINPKTALLWDQCVAKVLAQPLGTKNYHQILNQ